MPLTEYYWKSHDGLNLYAVQWPANEQSEVVVAFVHGHGDHCRRYDDWFSQLNACNISVLAFDYHGHGRSQGKPGVIRRYDDLLQDVALLHERAKELFPGIPVVLYGHSMGATMVLSYILRIPTPPEMAIGSSPWIKLVNPPGKMLSALLKIANVVLPFVTFKTGLQSSDFSVMDGYAEKREKDEFVHNRISPRLFSEVECEGQWIADHFNEIDTPLLLIQGGNDLIMDVTAVRKLCSRSQSCISYREWESAGHQLHNSERSGEVMAFIINWIKERKW